MPASDYINRKFDVLAFRGAQEIGETQLTQSLFDASVGGEVCTGVQKLSQRWALEFMTRRGSMGFHLATRGSDFMTWARAGRIRTEFDIQAYFNFAAQQVRQNMINEETADMHPEDRLGSATLINSAIYADSLELYVQIESLAGTSRQIILPISYAPINTSSSSKLPKPTEDATLPTVVQIRKTPEPESVWTTYRVDTASEIIEAINTLPPYSRIIIDSGSFDCSAEVLTPGPLLRIEGAGIGNTTILGSWFINTSTQHLVTVQDLTIDITGMDDGNTQGGFEVEDSNVEVERVHVTGEGAGPVGKSVSAFVRNTVCHLSLTDCIVDDSANDCVSTGALASQYPLISQSTCTLRGCTILRPKAGGDQCVTGHVSYAITCHDCTLSVGPNISATVARPGAGAAGQPLTPMYFYDCILDGIISGARWIERCQFTKDGSSNYGARWELTDPGGVVTGCQFNGGYTAAVFTTADNVVVENSYVTGATHGFQVNGAVPTTFKVINNTIDVSSRGLIVSEDATITVTFKNNVVDDGTNCPYVVAGAGSITWDSGYNCLYSCPPGGTGTHYVLDATDFTDAPEYVANIPILGGNLDAAGDPTVSLELEKDINGVARPSGGVIAIGAYEYTA